MKISEKAHEWIMIIKDIPVTPEAKPERMSIHPSWPHENFNAIETQKRKLNAEKSLGFESFDDDDDYFYTMFGKEPNWRKARKIFINGYEVVIHAHEYSRLDEERMRLYVDGDGADHPSHFIEAYSVEGEQLLKLLKDTDFKNVYESALLEGASEHQATLSAMGIDIVDNPFPPVGWYRLRDEYKEIFGV